MHFREVKHLFLYLFSDKVNSVCRKPHNFLPCVGGISYKGDASLIEQK